MGTRRVHAFAGMLAVSTDQILPNSVGDLALTQQGNCQCSWMWAQQCCPRNTACSCLRSVGLASSQNLIQRSHCTVYSSSGKTSVVLRFRDSVKYFNVTKVYGDWSHRTARGWWQLLRGCQKIKPAKSLFPLFGTEWFWDFCLFDLWFWLPQWKDCNLILDICCWIDLDQVNPS